MAVSWITVGCCFCHGGYQLLLKGRTAPSGSAPRSIYGPSVDNCLLWLFSEGLRAQVTKVDFHQSVPDGCWSSNACSQSSFLLELVFYLGIYCLQTMYIHYVSVSHTVGRERRGELWASFRCVPNSFQHAFYFYYIRLDAYLRCVTCVREEHYRSVSFTGCDVYAGNNDRPWLKSYLRFPGSKSHWHNGTCFSVDVEDCAVVRGLC